MPSSSAEGSGLRADPTPTVDVPTVTVDGEPLPLDKVLRAADRRTLAAVLTHLSGSADGIQNPRDWDEIIDVALRVLPPYLSGERAAAYPSEDLLQAAMDVAAGTTVEGKHLPMVQQQMRLAHPEPVAPLPVEEDFSFLVIGGGLTGILAGRMLQQYGVSAFTIVEKESDVGGAWRDNRYPGCRVDTPSIVYSYWFEPDGNWPDHFSFRPAVFEYLSRQAEPLRDHLRLDTEVRSMAWSEADRRWQVNVRTADGREETLEANAVISAMGALHYPSRPAILGLDSFTGPVVHSGEWPEDLDLAGKRIAVLGTGASANQIVPAVAPDAEHLTVFQRSPHWIMSHPRYGKPLAGTERWLIESIPFYLNWLRFKESWLLGDHILDALRREPGWPRTDSVSEGNEAMRVGMVEYATEQLRDRPDLLDKVLPDYPPHSKRILVDNGWYRTLLRPNVTLETDPILEVTRTGVRTAGGETPVDVIVLATGFRTGRVLWPIDIRGRNGVDVRERLDGDPLSYLGISLPDCPNLFVTYGPHGVTAHGGNGALLAELQLRYSLEAVRMAAEQGARCVEIKPEVAQRFTAEVREELKDYVWSTPGVSTWFKAGTSEPAVIYPRPFVDLWHEAQHPDADLYRTW